MQRVCCESAEQTGVVEGKGLLFLSRGLRDRSVETRILGTSQGEGRQPAPLPCVALSTRRVGRPLAKCPNEGKTKK